MLAIIRGAGDIATGIGFRLKKAGFAVIMTELEQPACIRRTVAFSSCIGAGQYTVEGEEAVECFSAGEALEMAQQGRIAVLVDAQAAVIREVKPDAVIDAILAKRNMGTRITDAPAVVGIGPGFTAGEDCHFVVETCRGHYLGKVIEHGPAQADTGQPGDIGGYTSQRLLRAPSAGRFAPLREIGDMVQPGEIVAQVGAMPIAAQIGGVVRGMLPPGLEVPAGFKCGDIDPRGDRQYIYGISDKARAVGGGALEAVLRIWGRNLGGQK